MDNATIYSHPADDDEQWNNECGDLLEAETVTVFEHYIK